MSNKMALDALTAALDAMEHMANTLNNMDAVDEDEDAQHDAAFEAVRAAIAALQAAEPQGWRPIETAPKDAHALLWIDIAIGQPLVVQGCWFHDDDADEKGWIDLDGNVLNATHWMPLPTPPKD